MPLEMFVLDGCRVEHQYRTIAWEAVLCSAEGTEKNPDDFEA